MKYIYPRSLNDFKKFTENANINCLVQFGMTVEELQALDREQRTDEMDIWLLNYDRLIPLGMHACTVNRICWLFESLFDDYKPSAAKDEFDYTILKSGVDYSKTLYNQIATIYSDYRLLLSDFMVKAKNERIEKDDIDVKRQFLKDEFKSQCDMVCPDETVLTDIVLDLCYRSNSSKSFAWDMCGGQIVKNLLKKHDNIINIPIQSENGEIEYNGLKFEMQKEILK